MATINPTHTMYTVRELGFNQRATDALFGNANQPKVLLKNQFMFFSLMWAWNGDVLTEAAVVGIRTPCFRPATAARSPTR
jgi:hypothetical protein